MSSPYQTDATQAESTGRWGKIPARWFDHPDIDADAVAVLAALSTFADRSGRCWPSQTTLAGKLKRSRSWVSKVISRLAAIGVLEVRDRWSDSGGRLSSVYVLALEAPAESGGDPVSDTTIRDSIVSTGNVPVAAADTPRSAGRHKHRNPEQTPDSRPIRAEAVRDTGEDCGRLEEVPDGWTPTPADLAWAAANFASVDPHRHAQGFVLRCRAHGYRYRDVGAAWRSWLMEDVAAGKAVRSAGSPGTTRPPQGTPAGERFDAWVAVAARLNGGATATPGMVRP